MDQTVGRRWLARITTLVLGVTISSFLMLDGGGRRTLGAVGEEPGASAGAAAAAGLRDLPSAAVSDPPHLPRPVATLAGPSETDRLHDDLAMLAKQSGARVSIALRELSGRTRASWSLNGGQVFTAASTYKLPVLMLEAQRIGSGQVSAAGRICFEDEDWEDGYFGDYEAGDCYTRSQLAWRVAHFSDNTAAHILVRDIGGSAALNRFARAHGAAASAFYDPNTTTADDLAALWLDEDLGRAGGTAAQRWLYPILTGTAYESGIPAGVPGDGMVAHKIGDYGGTVNDAALIMGPSTRYVLVVCTDGLDSARGNSLIARISARVWEYESGRAVQAAFRPAARAAPRVRTGF